MQTAMTSTGNYRLYKPRVFNETSRQRFFRYRRKELARHVGGAPSQAQLIVIERVTRNEWDLCRLDAQLDAGDLSAHAMRNRLAMENRLRLDLRELGMRSVAEKPPTLAEHLARRAAEKAAQESAEATA